MSLSQLFETIDRFFLDVIGTIIPGVTLICGLWMFFDVPNFASSVSLFPPMELFDWVLLIVGSYLAGYALVSIGENLVLKLVDNRATRWVAYKLCFQPTAFEEQLLKSIVESAEYRAVVDQATEKYSLPVMNEDKATIVHTWRNIALSIARDDSYLAWRFMFISLMNLGIATAALTLVVIWIFAGLSFSPVEVSVSNALEPWLFVSLIVVSVIFLERRYRFYSYSMRVPFSMAVVHLRDTEAGTEPARNAHKA